MKVSDIINENTSEYLQAKAYTVKKPVVSVLLPTYNKGEGGFLQRSVESVMHQDFADIELILIDDASTGKSTEIIDRLAAQNDRISLIKHRSNIGLPALSMYEGFLHAKGEYIAFLFDDTVWDSSFIGSTLRYMKYRGLKACYGVLHSYYGVGENDCISYGDPANGCDIDSLMTKNRIATCSAVVERSVFEKIGFFDPNLVLTKDYPWDMWLRIVRNYPFCASGIFCGNDISVTQKESLARTMSYSRWCIYEQMNKKRDLSLERYPDIHIDEIPQKSSFLFKELMQRRLDECKNKGWYRLYKPCESKESPRIIRRVLIIGRTHKQLVQSPFMSFARGDDDICYNFALAKEISREDIHYADAVIFVHDFDKMKSSVAYCSYLKIPCYLYVGSSFFKERKNASKLIEAGDFSAFKAIFVPTPAIKEIFETKQNTITVNIPFNNEHMQPYNPVNAGGQFRIAFSGSVNEARIFAEDIMPVLCEFSERYPLTVIYPDDGFIPEKYPAYKNISLVPTERTDTPEQEFWNLVGFRPQLLVHCSTNTSFDKLKMHSELLLACLLGSVLVSHNDVLYSSNSENICRIVYGDEKERITSMLEAFGSSKDHEAIYKNSLDFINETYDIKKSRNAVDAEVFKLGKPTEKSYASRFELLYYVGLKANAPEIDFEELIKTGGIKASREYKQIRCTTEPLFAVGIILAPDEKSEPLSGTVTLTLTRQNGDSFADEKELKDVEYGKLTYFTFLPIAGTLGERLSVTLKFVYDGKKQRACVYENAKNRKLIGKVTEGLNMGVAGCDVLFTDLHGEKSFGQM